MITTQKQPAKKKYTKKQEVVYPELEIKDRREGKDGPLTVEDWREILGWEECEEADRDTVPELYALFDKHVRMTRNQNNRFLRVSQILDLKQELLTANWGFNADTVKIGRFGNVQDGQHRGIAHLLAEEERLKNPSNWPHHKGPITMETLVVYGLSEDDNTFRTLNREAPSTTADTIYRSLLYSDLDHYERKEAARATDTAVRLLWNRTGMKADRMLGRLTSSEAMDWLGRHKGVGECVRFVMETDKPGQDEEGKSTAAPLSRYLTKGYISGLMYLMATSKSDGEKYRKGSPRNQKDADLSMMDRAKEFLTLLAQDDPSTLRLREAFSAMADSETGTGGSLLERKSLLMKAWNVWSKGKKMTSGAIRLDYFTEAGWVPELNEFPTAGGIDVGEGKKVVDEESGDEEPTEEEQAEQERAEREDKAKKEKEAHDKRQAKKGKAAASKKPKPAKVETNGDGQTHEPERKEEPAEAPVV